MFIAKKIVVSTLQNTPALGRHFKYSCSRDASAEIIKEVDPKKWRIKKTSHLNSGDSLQCEKLYVLVLGISKLKPKLITHSGRHKAEEYNSKSFSYAEITLSFAHIIHALENRKEEAASKNLTK